MEIHWTTHDPDLEEASTAALEAIALEVEGQLGVSASLSDPDVVAKIHGNDVGVGDICVPHGYCIRRFTVDETTKVRDVDLPFFYSGASKEYMKKAEKFLEKLHSKGAAIEDEINTRGPATKPPIAEVASVVEPEEAGPSKRAATAEAKDSPEPKRKSARTRR